MDGKCTLEEMRTKREIMHKEIQNLIDNFMAETGVGIISIDTETFHHAGMYSPHKTLIRRIRTEL